MIAQGSMTNDRDRGATSPADGRLPTLTWEDVETVVEDLADPGLKDAALALTRALRLESPHLSAMDLLRETILNAAAVMRSTSTPAAPPSSASRPCATTSPRLASAHPSPADGRLRRRFGNWWPPPSGSPPA